MFMHQLRPAGSNAVRAMLFVLGTITMVNCSATPQGRAAKHLAAGRASLAGKDFRRAAIEFKVASQNAPEDPEPIYQLAMAHLALKDGKAALQDLEKVLALKKNHEGALYEMGRLRAATNVPELLNDGADYLNRLLAEHPQNAAALYARAAIEVKLNRPEEAKATFETALRTGLGQMGDVQLPVGAAVAGGNLGLAQAFVALAQAQKPASAELATLSAELAMMQGNLKLAGTEVARALTLQPGYRKALQLRMRLEDRSGAPDKAEETAKELAAHPDVDNRAAYALLLVSHGKNDQALREFERLHAAFPKDHKLESAWIEFLIRGHRNTEARTALDQVLAGDRKRGDALLLRVRLALDEDLVGDAAKDLQALELLGYYNENVAFEKSRYHHARGERNREGDMLSEAVQRNPRMLRARLQLSRLLTESGKPEMALRILDDVVDEERATADYALFRTTALIAAGEWTQARALVNERLVAGRTADLVLHDAALRIHDRDLSGAEHALQQLLATEPTNTVALAEMGAIYQARKQTREYLAWLTKVAERNALSVPLQIYVAGVLREGGDLAGARRAIQRAESLGGHREADVVSAILDLQEGNVNAAKTRLLEAVQRNDDSYRRTLLADAFQRGGDWGQAEDNLHRATRLAPGEWLPYMNLAAVVARNPKRLEEALIFAEKAVSLAPGNPALEGSVGWMYYETGRYAQAVTHLEISLKASDTAGTRYRLAAACLKAGDAARAHNEYDAALRMNAKDPEREGVARLLASSNM